MTLCHTRSYMEPKSNRHTDWGTISGVADLVFVLSLSFLLPLPKTEKSSPGLSGVICTPEKADLDLNTSLGRGVRPWESRNNWYFIHLPDIGSRQNIRTNVAENFKAAIDVHLNHCGWFQVLLYCVITTNIGHDFLCTTKTTILLTARGGMESLSKIQVRNWD